MKIKATVNLMKDQTKNLKAFANITLDESFVVKGFKVMSGSKGLFVSMPSQKLTKEKDGKQYEDTAFPITAGFRKQLIETIIAEYEKKANAENLAAESSENKVESEKSDESTDDIPF